MISSDPLTDDRLTQDAAAAAAATDAYAESITTPRGSAFDRLEEAAGFVQDDLEDAWERSREISRNVGALSRAVVRSSPVASLAVAFGVGYVVSLLRARR